MNFKKLIKRYYFPLIIILFILYSAIAIFRSSFIIDNTRHFSLFDDMMISMRYAYNFAHGYGLVWNAGGERVEGISNILWTFYMALIHLLPIPLAKTSLAIQITAGICMIGTLWYVKKIASLLSSNSTFAVIGSLLFTAFYFPLIAWTVVLGTEVSILLFLLTFAVFLAIKSLQTKKFSLLLFIILGIGTLVRLDFIIPAITITIFLFITDSKNRRKYILLGLPIILSVVIMQTAIRYWYYQEFLPNTYYLKMTGYPILNRITRGAYVSLHFMNILLMLIPFVYIYFTKNKYVFLLLTVFSTQIIYNVYIGGDAQEWYGGANRFIAIVMPLFFIALFVSLQTLRELIFKRFSKIKNHYKLFETLMVIVLFLLMNTASNNMIFQLFFISKPLLTSDNKYQVEEAYLLKEITMPNAKIAVTHAGAAPYFTDRYFVDILGKNDKFIARQSSQPDLPSENRFEQYISYQPGHNKWDYPYIVEHYKPDIFAEFWQRGNKDEQKHLKKDYIAVRIKSYSFFVRKDSKYINWDMLKKYSSQ